MDSVMLAKVPGFLGARGIGGRPDRQEILLGLDG
jgi:hypothetical protein